LNLHFPGIYEIVHIASGKRYGGQAQDVHERWNTHKWILRRNCHHCRYLQNAWNKYGADAFEFRVIHNLSNVPKEQLQDKLDELEYELITSYIGDCYNTMRIIEHGFIGTPEHKAWFAKFHKALWDDPEHRENRIKAITDSYTDELRSLRSKTSIKYNARPEIKAAVSERFLKLWQSEEHRAEQSIKRKANWKDPEYVAKQKTSRQATWKDENVREKRIAGIKKANTPEVIAKRQEKAAVTWAKKKADGSSKWTEEQKARHKLAFQNPETKAKKSAASKAAAARRKAAKGN